MIRDRKYLNDAEFKILKLLRKGYTLSKIGKKLNKGKISVERTVLNMRRKLEVKNIPQLIFETSYPPEATQLLLIRDLKYVLEIANLNPKDKEIGNSVLQRIYGVFKGEYQFDSKNLITTSRKSKKKDDDHIYFSYRDKNSEIVHSRTNIADASNLLRELMEKSAKVDSFIEDITEQNN